MKEYTVELIVCYGDDGGHWQTEYQTVKTRFGIPDIVIDSAKLQFRVANPDKAKNIAYIFAHIQD